MASMQQIIDDFQRQASGSAALARQALVEAQAARGQATAAQQQNAALLQHLQQLQAALSRVTVQAQSGDPNIQRIENTPGRRIPFDFLCEMPFNAGNAAVQQAIITIDQTGPFVAVARSATFLSTFRFQQTDPESGSVLPLFSGRSYGRYRPIHSVNDLNDGQPYSMVSLAQAFPGTGAAHIASPSNASPFRSMEMDFRIDVREQGSSLPRNNIPVPSSMWVKANGDAYELGALDFFERSQVIQFNVQPMHVPNPAFGNISGLTGTPGDDWPFIESGWDAIEGINDPAIELEEETDPIVRDPSGVLIIGFHGYRIIQPPGPGQY